jgi:hypothetical protein
VEKAKVPPVKKKIMPHPFFYSFLSFVTTHPCEWQSIKRGKNKRGHPDNFLCSFERVCDFVMGRKSLRECDFDPKVFEPIQSGRTRGKEKKGLGERKVQHQIDRRESQSQKRKKKMLTQRLRKKSKEKKNRTEGPVHHQSDLRAEEKKAFKGLGKGRPRKSESLKVMISWHQVPFPQFAARKKMTLAKGTLEKKTRSQGERKSKEKGLEKWTTEAIKDFVRSTRQLTLSLLKLQLSPLSASTFLSQIQPNGRIPTSVLAPKANQVQSKLTKRKKQG